MRYHRVIGIDLGMTNSVVSVWDYENQKVVALPNPVNGATTIPSVVSQTDGVVIVGTNARDNLIRNPENTIVEIKRMLGEPADNTQNSSYPLKQVRFNGRDWLPQEILAFILKYLKTIAENYIGEPVHDAVLTLPAYFTERRKNPFLEAAEIAQLNVTQLLREPQAAAIGFGIDKDLREEKDLYLIYNLAASNFDLTLISGSSDGLKIRATAGDENFGGKDFDDCLTDYVLSQILDRYQIDLRQNSKACEYIKYEAELRKCELSHKNATTLTFPYLTPQLTDISIDLHRTTFESSITPKLNKMLSYLDQLFEDAYEKLELARDDVKQVLLVGGSTRIPIVRNSIADYMKDRMWGAIPDVRIDFDPSEVVSRGATLLASRFQPSNAYEGKDFRNPAA